MTQIILPPNTPSTLHLIGERTIGEIIESAKNHFGEEVDLDSLIISGEEIQVSCHGYDQYDGSDYRRFIVIEKS